MLTPSQVSQYADYFIEARAHSRRLRVFPQMAKISMADAYAIALKIQALRLAAGEVQLGRKIGFANNTIWEKYGKNAPIQGPIWTPLFDSTVRYLDVQHTLQSLLGAVQPRLAPQIIFKLGSTPAVDATMDELADSLEWMAHGVEVVVCPFPNWQLNTVDAIAAFGMHGTLLIGEPHQLASSTRHQLGSVLANTTVSLSCDDTLVTAGFGSNLLESPLHALWHLQQLLKSQPETTTVQAGEIVSTGTWSDPCPIAAGQTWSSAFSGATLAGLSVSFV